MVDDWMRKYHVLAGQAHFKAPEPRHEEPAAKPAPAVVVDDKPAAAPVVAVEEPVKKPARKIKKELNDAAKMPRRKAPAKKTAAKRKPASHKPE